MEEVTTLFDSDEAENEYMKEREEKEKPDYIDRAHYCKHICKCNRDKCDRSACPIWNAPSAVVAEVRHGKNLEADTPSLFECSECHWYDWDTTMGYTSVYNYCPNCGAKMDGKEAHNG